ncbi:MAG: hypothetical protein DRH93_17580 [Deltaproteobacteria bacterium]|nr:MAG: hypothetical protein DRH93_17580 [Deltaproteobacteria bacterium]
MHFHTENVKHKGALDPKVYIEKYSSPIPLLQDKGFVIFNEKITPSVLNKGSLIAEYKEFVESRRKPKPYKAYDHDMVVLLATERNRSADKNSVLDAGAFFLTCDYHLYAFDKYYRSENRLNSIVLPNHLLQVLRPLIPNNENFDKRFVATFAIPEFRTVGSDYSETISKVMAYLATFKDIKEETASRILGDHVLIHNLQGVNENSEKFAESVENALSKHNEELIEEIAVIKQVYKNSLEEKRQIADRLDEQEQSLKSAKDVIAAKEDTEKIRQKEIENLKQQLSDIKNNSLTAIEAEKYKYALKIDKKKAEISTVNKQKFVWRIFGAFSFSILLTLLYYFQTNIQTFIQIHPSKHRISILIMVIIWGLFFSISFEKYRKWTIGTVVVACIVALITII